MIPNRTDTVEVVSNIDSDATGQFSVDENSLAKIMSVLTNLYSDPEGAVAREYLTNALDSQIEAQANDPSYKWRPIEVTTPSHFNKTYKVRDFGVGMNASTLRDTYSKYGKSTKESSNAVTGMLGLGSKCALTYTGQFTITGFKDGVRTQAVISKDDNDIPVFMIVDTSATTEPNGVEISVPVRDRNSFEKKTADLLRWWEPGTVLVNGVEPEHHHGIKVKDGVYLLEENTNAFGTFGQSYIIMGNVPYALDGEYIPDEVRRAGISFAAYVPMGAVDFPPSRERLFYNNRTKKVVAEVCDGLYAEILKEKLRPVREATERWEAWKAWRAVPYPFNSSAEYKALTFKGEAFPTYIDFDHRLLYWDYNGRAQTSEQSRLHVDNYLGSRLHTGGVLILVGVDDKQNLTPSIKKKVKHYCEESDTLTGSESVIIVDKDISNPWLAGVERVDLDAIKAIKLPRNPSARSTAAPTYEVYWKDNGTVETSNLETIKVSKGKQLTYISPADMRETYRRAGTNPVTFMNMLHDKYVLVVLATNRFEKFLRLYPNAIHAKVAAQETVDTYVNKASKTEYLVGELEYGEERFLKAVDPSKLDDPELASLANAVRSQNSTPWYDKARSAHLYFPRAGIHTSLAESKHANAENPCKQYPLIEHVGSRNIDHLVIYCNSIYAIESGS